jgi:hypothetical protein
VIQPVVAIDASVWIRQALSNPRLDSKILSQFHAAPRVPVGAASSYVKGRANVYRQNKYRVVLVFDGRRHPLKDDEHDIRTSKADRKTKEEELEKAYQHSESHTQKKVHTLQKEVMHPREDVVQEVVRSAKLNGYPVTSMWSRWSKWICQNTTVIHMNQFTLMMVVTKTLMLAAKKTTLADSFNTLSEEDSDYEVSDEEDSE